MDENVFLTPEQVAKNLGVQPRTVKNWRYLGIGPPYIKIERSIRYPVKQFTEYVEARMIWP